MVAAVALLVGVLGACAPPSPEPLPPTPTARDLPVGHELRWFVDPTRVIPGFDWVFGGRPIPTDIWYPTDRAQAPYPLVLFAHGFGVGPTDYTPLLERIASAGYVVAAPTYPVLSGWPYGPSDVDDWPEKFPDTWFVTDSMLALAWIDPTFAGLVDGRRLAIAGHSDGALIAFGDGFGEGHEDGRVRAVVAYAAALYGQGYRPNGRSLLHVVSELDQYNPFGPAVDWDATIVDPRWTVALWGADHGGPFFDPGDLHWALVANTTVDFLDQELKGEWWGPLVIGVEWSGIANFV